MTDPMREAFETDARQYNLPVKRDGDGYQSVTTNVAWQRWKRCWKAALEWSGDEAGRLRGELAIAEAELHALAEVR